MVAWRFRRSDGGRHDGDSARATADVVGTTKLGLLVGSAYTRPPMFDYPGGMRGVFRMIYSISVDRDGSGDLNAWEQQVAHVPET